MITFWAKFEEGQGSRIRRNIRIHVSRWLLPRCQTGADT